LTVWLAYQPSLSVLPRPDVKCHRNLLPMDVNKVEMCQGRSSLFPPISTTVNAGMVTASSNPCGILICTRLALRPAAPPPHASSADSIRHKTRTHKSLCRFESVIARRHTNRSRGWDGDHRRWVRNIIQHITTHHSAIHSPLGPRNHQRARLLKPTTNLHINYPTHPSQCPPTRLVVRLGPPPTNFPVVSP